MEKREEICTRLTGGQSVAGIAQAMGLNRRTVYRLKKRFAQPNGQFTAVAPQSQPRRSIDRGVLIKISGWLSNENSKMTLEEVQKRLVEDDDFKEEDVPHTSTIWRRLKSMGFAFRQAKYEDQRALRTAVQYERCSFRMAQNQGLDPCTLLSFDESNFFFEQATKAWGSTVRAPKLPKPKGKVPRRSLLATIGFTMDDNDVPLGFIHWVLIPPRPSFRPLADEIEEVEVKDGEAQDIQMRLSLDLIASLSLAGLKNELKRLGIRSTETTKTSMSECLLRVMRNRSRVGELRARGRGRPSLGGQVIPPTGNARMTSEYLYSCLLPFLNRGVHALHNSSGFDCDTSADEGIESCPDYGKIEGNRGVVPNLGERSILWDSAPSHQPSNHLFVSPFHRYLQKLGLAGVVHTPPYSPFLNPIELLFSYLKRYCRKHAPPNTKELLVRLREASDKIDGRMIANWYKKCGFIIPGSDPEQTRDPPDPANGEGSADARCFLPKNTTFERREHIACFDRDGKLRREKRQGSKKWGKYDELRDSEEDSEDESVLHNLSQTKRTGILPKKRVKIAACAPPELGETRWTGIGPEPPGLQHAPHDHLWDRDQYHAVEAVVDERKVGGKTEYLVKWLGYDDTFNEWLPEERFAAGKNSLIHNWRDRAKRLGEQKALEDALIASANEGGNVGGNDEIVPVNRTKLRPGMVVALNVEGNTPFILAKVKEVKKREKKVRIHWLVAPKIDGRWSLEFTRPAKGKKTGKPNEATVWEHTVIDTVPSLENKNNGKMSRKDFDRIVHLSREAQGDGSGGAG